MSVLLICDQEVVGSISSGSIDIFLALTHLVESELQGVSSGFSFKVSDEILIDRCRFLDFVDLFFSKAQTNGRFIYFVYWAHEINEVYKNITGQTLKRTMLNAKQFENQFR